ncbi:hypothetical protein FEK35_25475 [Nocardia cyriacigeorgica]|uniref:Uncharacterized protein n=1 Tax=Nocardia cyriacigeorgica TaxID=135487 RepID=A0A5R8P752_9NOCA|nr:hypothetical protein FEK35_25475 [Nocardia cyriacigeorgica]
MSPSSRAGRIRGVVRRRSGGPPGTNPDGGGRAT